MIEYFPTPTTDALKEEFRQAGLQKGKQNITVFLSFDFCLLNVSKNLEPRIISQRPIHNDKS